MAPVSFDEFSISGAKVFLCSSPSDCKRNSNFCDFSYGDSGTCVPCPSGGTDCASYLSSDMKKGMRACTFRCFKWTGIYKYSSHYLHYHKQKITYNLLILQTEHHPLEQPRTTISKRHSQQHLKWLNPYERNRPLPMPVDESECYSLCMPKSLLVMRTAFPT